MVAIGRVDDGNGDFAGCQTARTEAVDGGRAVSRTSLSRASEVQKAGFSAAGASVENARKSGR